MQNNQNEIGRKTFFWYRVYCGVLIALYLAVIVLGVTLAVLRPETREYKSEEVFVVGLIYAVGIQSSTTVWAPGTRPLPPKPWSGKGRRPTRLRRDDDHT